MEYTRCPNPSCLRLFQVNRFSGYFAGLSERGVLRCPHCGLSLAEAGDSVFLTHALSSDEEAALDCLQRSATAIPEQGGTEK